MTESHFSLLPDRSMGKTVLQKVHRRSDILQLVA
jgi:hypothetical protein